ncbi:hypothetical protein CHS0354_005478 [Potamilus streckersoni]|uniref:Chitin-binding type-2 domain-containing protein n=1 Tax=Potamilus streckersoni TaxID=2493646 RepID=A0AAE0SFM1_9BIVA|nr:hypothetical protein CHS0354_005478 [Potamilus streckersoni]
MGAFVLIVLAIMATLQSTYCSTRCVDSCVGVRDGDYQNCRDCHKFVSCSNGYKYDMPCPSNLVWDDNVKRCEWKSNTCP